ncbi:putative Fe-S cluster protein YjdI [Chitinophaga skermanii]|uniref:Putative Fe-S cluster protein YjdI n=1 Tax=Chitinophaga skermanii TaxID=331697 RepID=A0A327QNR9_9BACT|nr:(4Fe-4S)-binding protein [Chitinophaga skermanii]RAJ05302.1 putative Fe-S cluster protein YjdI [Chitinophaga skermanii]
MEAKIEYSNGEVTVVWKPTLCQHTGICARGLPSVFQPKERPWIKTDGATTNEIIAQVKQCPSGALSYYMNADKKPTTGS